MRWSVITLGMVLNSVRVFAGYDPTTIFTGCYPAWSLSEIPLGHIVLTNDDCINDCQGGHRFGAYKHSGWDHPVNCECLDVLPSSTDLIACSNDDSTYRTYAQEQYFQFWGCLPRNQIGSINWAATLRDGPDACVDHCGGDNTPDSQYTPPATTKSWVLTRPKNGQWQCACRNHLGPNKNPGDCEPNSVFLYTFNGL